MKSRSLTRVLFIFYFLSLFWILLFKMPFSFNEIIESFGTMRSLNIHPFAAPGMVNNQIDWGEIIDNVIVFVPFGIFMGMLHPNRNFLRKIFPVILTTFCIEGLQYFLAIGASDITDLLMNTLGGILGIVFFLLLRKRLKSRAYLFMNGLFLGGAIGMILLLIMIYRVNLIA